MKFGRKKDKQKQQTDIWQSTPPAGDGAPVDGVSKSADSALTEPAATADAFDKAPDSPPAPAKSKAADKPSADKATTTEPADDPHDVTMSAEATPPLPPESKPESQPEPSAAVEPAPESSAPAAAAATKPRRDGVSRKVTTALIITSLLTTIGAGAGAWFIRDKQANDDVNSLKQENQELTVKLKKAGGGDTSTGSLGGGDLGGGTTSQSQTKPDDTASPSQNVDYSSANTGFSLKVPDAWAGKWRYLENSAIGISTTSATFYLINKDLKYAEVVSVAKVPEDKYNDARATGQPIANADNLIVVSGGNAYVMAFANSSGDYKDFTYADAVKAAKESIKASFKPL